MQGLNGFELVEIFRHLGRKIWERGTEKPSGLNRVNELTLTTALVTTTKGINLPTTTVFRISLVAPVIVIQLIYPIIF